MQQRADDVNGGDSNEPAGEGEALDADDAEREIDAEHGAERRPGGGAENVGRDQRIANRPWNAVPATASAPPTSTAATTRGPRTNSTTFSTAGGTAAVRPMSRETRTSMSSASVTG